MNLSNEINDNDNVPLDGMNNNEDLSNFNADNDLIENVNQSDNMLIKLSDGTKPPDNLILDLNDELAVSWEALYFNLESIL